MNKLPINGFLNILNFLEKLFLILPENAISFSKNLRYIL